MMKESLLYKVMSAIHVILFVSVLCFGITLLSGTLLMIPSIAAAFVTGRMIIYNEFDINDSIIKSFFREFKKALCLLRFIPVNLILLFNIVGIMVAVKLEMTMYAVLCLVIIALLLTMIFYIAGFYVFIANKMTLVEVAFCMFYKPTLLIPLFSAMVIFTFFFQGLIVKILLASGFIFLFIIELVVFLHMLYYKQLNGIEEEGEYAQLVKYAMGKCANLEITQKK